MMYHHQTNWSQQTIEQTKFIQEVVSPEVSKLNYTVMNKKQGDEVQFSPEKRLEKRKWIHHTPCQPIIPVGGMCYKMRYQFINYTIKFFIYLKMFIMQWRKTS